MSEIAVPKGLDLDVLREEIKKEYQLVAANPEKGYHFHTGRPLAKIVKYKEEWLHGVPENVLASFAGTGNPFSMGEMQPGQRVLDLGCGAGIDSFIAANQVGGGGAVVGIDMTEEMLDKAKRARDEAGLSQLDFKAGYLEDLPVDDEWADVVISNGSINLCPDKLKVYQEILRVLKPGGRIQMGDIMVSKPVSESAKENIALWTGWIAGALLEAELAAVIKRAGFKDFAITWKAPVFDGAPQSSSASAFGTVGINFQARKP